MKLYKNYIDGKWLESESKDIIQVDDPATGKIIGEISCAKKNEVDLAVSAAKAAFNSRILVDMPLLERGKLMHRIADETRKVADEGGKMLCYENGKMLGSAIKEFNDVADMFDYYAGLTDKLEGKTIPVSPTIFDYTVLEPFGVSAHIVPWNFPISMVGRSLACSFATGNSTIVKTAELTPLSATFLAKAIENAGVPNGLINIICGYGNEAGSYLVSHPDVNHVVFTGSVSTGKKILHSCADKTIPAVIELGGKSAGIVYEDADLDQVIESARHGIFGVAGQICTAMSRLVVHKSVKDFGLGAGVFTKDLKKASWTASKLESGQVYVNKWFAGNHATPFGGYKQSGYSREKGVDALKSYLQVKNVGISLD